VRGHRTLKPQIPVNNGYAYTWAEDEIYTSRGPPLREFPCSKSTSRSFTCFFSFLRKESKRVVGKPVTTPCNEAPMGHTRDHTVRVIPGSDGVPDEVLAYRRFSQWNRKFAKSTGFFGLYGKFVYIYYICRTEVHMASSHSLRNPWRKYLILAASRSSPSRHVAGLSCHTLTLRRYSARRGTVEEHIGK
jgi:hypothetical protein